MPNAKQLRVTLLVIFESFLIGWLCLSGMIKTSPNHSIILGIIFALACNLVTVVCHRLYQPLKPYLQQKAPLTISTIIIIMLAVLILQTPTQNIYTTAIGILFYTRLIKGLVKGQQKQQQELDIQHTHIAKFLTSIIATLMGATIAGEASNLNIVSFIPFASAGISTWMSMWMCIFLLATIFTLWQSVNCYLLIPVKEKCIKWQQRQAILAQSADSRSIMQKFFHHTRIGMLSTFMLLQILIGECYWLKTLIEQQQPSLILVFLVANIGFLCALYLFSQAKLPTSCLLIWGLAGSAVTAPLQFMIGDSSSWVIALAGQGFYLLFAASSFMGCWQQLTKLMQSKATINSLIMGASITLILFLGILSTSIKHIKLFNQTAYNTSIMISLLITGFAIIMLLGHLMISKIANENY